MFDMTTNGFVATINSDDGKEMPRYRKELNAALSQFTKEALPLYKQLETYRANNSTSAFDSIITDLSDQVLKKVKQAQEKIDKAYADYLERLEAAYTAKETQVAPGILALLDPDKVTMTQEEFTLLADQYDTNVAMRIALRSYADKKGLLYYPPIGLSEKQQLAERVHRTALNYLPDPTAYCPSEWVVVMDGQLLNEANPLTE